MIDEKLLSSKIMQVMDGDVITLNMRIDLFFNSLEKLEEKIRCIETKLGITNSADDEAMIDEYLHEGYDRARDDEEEVEDE